MVALLQISISVLVVAFLVSLFAVFRQRDGRLWILALTLALMAFQQMLTVAAPDPASPGAPTSLAPTSLSQSTNVLASILALAFTVSLTGSAIGRDQQKESDERRLAELQGQLAHVGRLSLMGEMAASIAHEVNQPIYAISNFAQACANKLEGMAGQDELIGWTKDIHQEATRAGEIIKRLREFTRKGEGQLSTFDLHELIDETLQLLRFEADRRGQKLEHVSPPTACRIQADRIQLQQVIANLVHNALESCDAQRGRLVTVASHCNQEQVRLTVRDNGPGISSQALEHLFDPFFTTKPHGMGMGLAISRTIVTSHRGKLYPLLDQANGATFVVELPLRQSSIHEDRP